MARSAELGTEREVELRQGRLRYRERGEGPAVVFVHGLFANADLWREVVPGVAAAGFRCVAPDLPLGGHEVAAAPDADLSPAGVADLLAGFLEALDLRDVVVVANDTGGAVVQLLMTSRPERIGRVVLTPCDSFRHFFPPLFKFLRWLGAIPGSTRLLGQILRVRALRDLPLGFGWLCKRGLPDDIAESFGAPLRADAGVRRDAQKFMRGAHHRLTMAAAERLPAFDRPVLLAWAREDRVFPVALAHRLAALLPDARVELIDDSYTFVPLDQPSVLVEQIVRFAAPRAAAS